MIWYDWSLFLIVLGLVPVIWGIASKLSTRPESSRAMQKRLEGIRRGYDTDVAN